MKTQLDALSSVTGASKSTVSKAVRHCFGVEKESRELILKTARKMGLKRESACDYYCIFPDRPGAFWSKIIAYMSKLCPELQGKFNVYPADSDFVFEDYLAEASSLGAGIILTCVHPNDKRMDLLRKASEHIPVIFLFERVDIVNTFCISSDAAGDGAALRKHVGIADGSAVILGDGSKLSEDRIQGFTDGFCGNISKFTVPADISAAKLARVLNNGGIKNADIVYNSVGQLRETALAAVKLKFGPSCIALGHDFCDTPFSDSFINGIRCVGISPNWRRICEYAADAVKKFDAGGCVPDSKYTVLPSTNI